MNAMMDGLWQMTLRNGVVQQAWLFPSTATQKNPSCDMRLGYHGSTERGLEGHLLNEHILAACWLKLHTLRSYTCWQSEYDDTDQIKGATWTNKTLNSRL